MDNIEMMTTTVFKYSFTMMRRFRMLHVVDYHATLLGIGGMDLNAYGEFFHAYFFKSFFQNCIIMTKYFSIFKKKFCSIFLGDGINQWQYISTGVPKLRRFQFIYNIDEHGSAIR